MPRQQAIVIGLGQFGMSLARALTRLGTEVLAVDRNEDRVQIASEFATEAVAIDAMDEADLARLRPASRDLCVCAIGDESREASIMVTAMLRQMGARRLVARATDEVHERILHLVGAHEVLNPERVMGERVAAQVSYRGVIDVLPLGGDVVIHEVATPVSARGRTLAELQLPKRFGLTVLGVRRVANGETTVELPSAELVLASEDAILVVGRAGAAHRFAEES